MKDRKHHSIQEEETAAEDDLRLVFLSTYPPRACGIATFTQDLVRELEKVSGIAAPSRSRS